jgi:lysyl-tRNA synthetase class 2
MPARDAAAATWQPTAAREVLALRAALLVRLRAFFAVRGVLEVDTPVLLRGATTDPHIESLHTEVGGMGRRYLHTSPEFAMKRLLAAGAGDIYQVCKVFRDEERGRCHNVEFTMLEWYRVGYDHHALMDEVQALLSDLLGSERIAEAERLTFRDALVRHAGIDPDTAGVDDCLRCLAGADVAQPATREREELIDLILGEVVGPRLGRVGVTFVCDYPPNRAALARIRAGAPRVAERFEVYLDGVELGNGFHELTDAAEQRRRFELDLRERERLARRTVPIDERLLAALGAGLPDCAGVALGIERILMLAARARTIDEVIAFTTERA